MLLRLAAEGSSTPEVVFGVGLIVATIVGLLFRWSRIQATRRLLAAADAYAEREIAQDPRIPAREFMTSALPG
jgi:hypothetical protein